MHVKVGVSAAALLICATLAGCGGGGSSSNSKSAAAAALAKSIAQATKPPPVSDLELTTGSPAHQITETLVSFYRAAWQDDAARACALFSPAGEAGFMQASKEAFPGSIDASSPCTHAMQLFSAALGDSVSNLQQNDPSVNGDILNNVGVTNIQVHGAQATVFAPMNVEQIINPKRVYLVQTNGRWRIDKSQSLNKSNLPEILKKAQQKGELSPKKHK
jgi:hypothetical protein